MNVTLYELAKSRDAVIDLRAGSTVHSYLALVYPPYDVSDDQDLITYCRANLTARYGYQLLRTLDVQSQGGPVWMVKATYGFDEGDAIAAPAGSPLPYEFSFDTTGGTQHITQSLATVSSVKYGVPVATRSVNDLTTVGPRNVTDAVTTAGSATLTSATAAFTASDVGAVLTSTTANMLPAVCTIESVTNGTTVILSSKALSTQAAGDLTISSVVLESATAAFAAADVGCGVTSTTPNVLPDSGCAIARILSGTRATISGGTILSSQTVANLTIGALAATNYNRAIGVSRDGVAGTDVVAPKLEFQMVRNFAAMTLNYIAVVHNLTGCVNDSEFYGFPPGELLFLGATGAPSQNNQAAAGPLVRVTFRFAGSANRTALDLVPDDSSGNHLLRVDKKGWEYLWVYYKDEVDPISRQTRPRPDAAYVEQVYREGDFSLLLIGTG